MCVCENECHRWSRKVSLSNVSDLICNPEHECCIPAINYPNTKQVTRKKAYLTAAVCKNASCQNHALFGHSTFLRAPQQVGVRGWKTWPWGGVITSQSVGENIGKVSFVYCWTFNNMAR